MISEGPGLTKGETIDPGETEDEVNGLSLLFMSPRKSKSDLIYGSSLVPAAGTHRVEGCLQISSRLFFDEIIAICRSDCGQRLGHFSSKRIEEAGRLSHHSPPLGEPLTADTGCLSYGLTRLSAPVRHSAFPWALCSSPMDAHCEHALEPVGQVSGSPAPSTALCSPEPRQGFAYHQLIFHALFLWYFWCQSQLYLV